MLVLSALRIGFAEKAIIDDASAAFERGTVTLLVGANAAGKTTLLRAMAGNLPAGGGSISIDGKAIDPRSFAWKRRRVFVEADGGYLDDFSPQEQLRLRATLLELDTAEGELRADRLETAFGFGSYRDVRASDLSTGFKRRLAFALAFMSDAEILLLDEPLNGLDVEGASALVRVLRSFSLAGGTAVVASHIIQPLLQVADAAMEIHDGRLDPYESVQALANLRYGDHNDIARIDGQGTFPWLARQR